MYQGRAKSLKIVQGNLGVALRKISRVKFVILAPHLNSLHAPGRREVRIV